MRPVLPAKQKWFHSESLDYCCVILTRHLQSQYRTVRGTKKQLQSALFGVAPEDDTAAPMQQTPPIQSAWIMYTPKSGDELKRPDHPDWPTCPKSAWEKQFEIALTRAGQAGVSAEQEHNRNVLPGSCDAFKAITKLPSCRHAAVWKAQHSSRIGLCVPCWTLALFQAFILSLTKRNTSWKACRGSHYLRPEGNVAYILLAVYPLHQVVFWISLSLEIVGYRKILKATGLAQPSLRHFRLHQFYLTIGECSWDGWGEGGGVLRQVWRNSGLHCKRPIV